MSGFRGFARVACVAALVGSATTARAQVDLPDGFVDESIVGGLDQPTALAFLPDGRALILEQRTARIRLVVGNGVTTIGTVPEVNAAANEQGLLGIAVDPQWPARPYVYVHYDHVATSTIFLTRFPASGDLVDAASTNLAIDTASPFFLLTDIPDNAPNHNGGTVRFGPDGMLYESLGEDADSCAAQDVNQLKGKILRLNVAGLPAGSGGPPAKSALVAPGNPFVGVSDEAGLVWAYGLRNPYRFQIDPATGDLFIGDVGESRFEEEDWARGPGQNFGWPLREGPQAHTTACVAPPGVVFTDPIASYDRTGNPAAAIESAGPYRSAHYPFDSSFPPSYEGNVFFADYYMGFLRRVVFDGASWVTPPAEPGQPNATNWATGLQAPNEFLVGPDGALWYVSQFDHFVSRTGSVRRIRFDFPSAVPSLRGTVNAGAGEIVDVLRANGSSGAPRRTLLLPANQSFVVTLAASPSISPARFALYGWPGAPSPSSVRALPAGVGTISFGICVNGRTPPFVANNFDHVAELCAPNVASSPAPTSFTVPASFARAGRVVTIQGVIEDRASAGTANASVTNAIVVGFR